MSIETIRAGNTAGEISTSEKIILFYKKVQQFIKSKAGNTYMQENSALRETKTCIDMEMGR